MEKNPSKQSVFKRLYTDSQIRKANREHIDSTPNRPVSRNVKKQPIEEVLMQKYAAQQHRLSNLRMVQANKVQSEMQEKPNINPTSKEIFRQGLTSYNRTLVKDRSAQRSGSRRTYSDIPTDMNFTHDWAQQITFDKQEGSMQTFDRRENTKTFDQNANNRAYGSRHSTGALGTFDSRRNSAAFDSRRNSGVYESKRSFKAGTFDSRRNSGAGTVESLRNSQAFESRCNSGQKKSLRNSGTFDLAENQGTFDSRAVRQTYDSRVSNRETEQSFDMFRTGSSFSRAVNISQYINNTEFSFR